MSAQRRLRRWLIRALVLLVAAVLVSVAATLLFLQSAWGKEQLRALAVGQANRYLTATLELGKISGSLWDGLELHDVRLTRGSDTLVAIDRVAVGYGIRELVEGGTRIRRLELDRPRISAARDADGRWNLASLLRRDPQRQGGPGRPVRIETIVVRDGTVSIDGPLAFGAAAVPTGYSALNATVSFVSQPTGWSVDVADTSFIGTAPDLTLLELSGNINGGPDGWSFRALHVRTPRSDFTLNGGVDRRESPSRLGLEVAAPRFAFQEWSGVVSGLRNIAVESGFDVRLDGPLKALRTTLSLRSDGGAVEGDLVLDTLVPGWHAAGTTTIRRLDLARWLNRADRPSDISGTARFDLDLQLGRHFPRGSFAFTGSHAAYLDYEADNVTTRGTITDAAVRLSSVTATAYGADVRLTPSSISIGSPYAFHFVGRADGLDLRQLPRTIPVPHVESTLTLEFDAAGQFASPFIRASAVFDESEFLGARIASGAAGSIDTQQRPFKYTGAGDVVDLDLNHFGDGLDVAWLRDPRYAGSVRGHFYVEGNGSDAATMTLSGGGRLAHASIFRGQLREADVEIKIAGGSLEATYDGELVSIDPSVPMADVQYRAELTGRGRGRVAIRDLLLRSPELNDYHVTATLSLVGSTIRGLDLGSGTVDATIAGGVLSVARLSVLSPGVDAEAEGTVPLDGVGSSHLDYRITRSDLAKLEALLQRAMTGDLRTTGILSGPLGALHVSGSASLVGFDAGGVMASTTSISYDVTIPDGDVRLARGSLRAQLASIEAFGRQLPEVEADVTYDAGTVAAHLRGTLEPAVALALNGTFQLDTRARTVDIATLVVSAGRTTWRTPGSVVPRLAWTESGIEVRSLALVDVGSAASRLTADGTWIFAGGGLLRLGAERLSIDVITSDPARPALYGGTLDATAELTGTNDVPAVSADFSIVEGRVRRLPFDRLAGHIDYKGHVLTLDVRMDQAPGAWITAAGTVPDAIAAGAGSGEPIHLTVRSSPISLNLLEGLSDQVRNVAGVMQVDVTVSGSADDPHFDGRAEVTGASFQVASSGARYRNGRLALNLAVDRVDVQTLHVEDSDGDPLDVTGSLGTHDRRVGSLQVEATARNFQVLRNDFGTVDVDARLSLSGEFESPRLTGRISVTGRELMVDRILDRTLYGPYSTEAAPAPASDRLLVDPLAVLNPWDRMGIDVELNVPRTLRLVGDNLQAGPGTPIGLGSINLRVLGDLYLYKDPAQPLYVNGSLDQVTGTYVFQGRRFELDPTSSINFRGDLSPELYVTVRRVISGVETRVAIVGTLNEPELRLTSTPPLDPSDILSLIVFNTSVNQLSAGQQQQLGVRAGALAAGFLAAPMLSTLERTLGIETLEIETGGDVSGAPRMTIGNEIAPGLVARFSRQFGENQYDEATLEYYLSRILRLRATFSDAGSVTAMSPFRRVERAGIDLLFFFSF